MLLLLYMQRKDSSHANAMVTLFAARTLPTKIYYFILNIQHIKQSWILNYERNAGSDPAEKSVTKRRNE